MFRWVAIVLLLCLPLQWSWAASGGLGASTCACASTPDIDMACGHADGCGDESAADCCSDCGYGQLPAGLLGAVAQVAHDPAEALHGVVRVLIPDPVPDHPLRPPSTQHG